jgi:hypothetical protein
MRRAATTREVPKTARRPTHERGTESCGWLASIVELVLK